MVDRGFKLTGRDGAKGVVSDIRKPEDMPRTADGLVADLLISGESPFNRLIDGQYNEQFINYASETIVNRIRESTATVEEQYDYIMKYVNIVRPVYAKYLMENTINSKADFVDAVKQDGLYLIIPPFCKNIAPKTIKRIMDEMNIDQQYITYATYDAAGNRIVHNVENKGIIGYKHIYLLGKIPLDQVNCVEYGYTSQFGLPIRPGSKSIKSQSLIGQTPCRYGEDETFILCMSTNPAVIKRMYGIYATSPVAMNMMQYALLTAEKPTDIDHIPISTEDIIKTDISIALLKHQFAEVGYEIVQIPESKQ
jgi:hypothetical protein